MKQNPVTVLLGTFGGSTGVSIVVTLEPVTSSQIEAIGYDADTKTLLILFPRDSLYRYADVTQEEFHALKTAPSIGSHFGKYIKPRPLYVKVPYGDTIQPPSMQALTDALQISNEKLAASLTELRAYRAALLKAHDADLARMERYSQTGVSVNMADPIVLQVLEVRRLLSSFPGHPPLKPFPVDSINKAPPAGAQV